MMINSDKLLGTEEQSGNKISGSAFLSKVNRKILSVNLLLKGTLAADKSRKRREEENEKRQNEEDRLEKPSALSNPKNQAAAESSRGGIVGWFKNFIGKILLGFFAVKLLKFVPLLSKIAPAFEASVNFLSSVGVGLVDGFGTFINVAYSAADATKGFLKSIGGDKTVEMFEGFGNAISTLIDVLIIASLVRGRGDDGFGGGRGRRRGRRGGPDFDFDKPDRRRRRRRGGRSGRSRAGANIVRSILGVELGRRFFAPRAAKAARESIGNVVSRNAENLERQANIIKQQAARIKKLTKAGRLSGREITTARRKITKVQVSSAQLQAQSVRQMIGAGAGTGGARSLPPGPPSLPVGTRVTDPKVGPFLKGLEDAAEKRRVSRLPVKADPFMGMMTDVDHAILDSIQDDPNLSVNQKQQRILQYNEALKKKADALRNSPGAQNLDRARFQQEIDSFEGTRPTQRFPNIRTGEDDLLDAIKNVPSRKKSFLMGTRKFLRGARLPLIGALLDFGISWMLGEDPGRAAFKAIGAGLLGAAGTAAGSVVPVAGNVIGGIAGGIAGDAIGGFLYDVMFRNKKQSAPPTEYRSEGGYIGQGINRRRLIDAPPELPGNIKFENNDEGPFSSPSAANLIRKQGIDLSKADYFGPMLALSAKILTGERPTDSDYKNASLGINLLLSDGFKSGQLTGDVQVSGGGTLAKWLQNTFSFISNPINDILSTINNLIIKIQEAAEKGTEQTVNSIGAAVSGAIDIFTKPIRELFDGKLNPKNDMFFQPPALPPLISPATSKPLPTEALLATIGFAEGTTASYGTIYGGNVVPELARGELTIQQVLNMMKTGKLNGRSVGYKVDKHNSDATGKYQFMSYVLEEEMRVQKLSPNTKFTPALQDSMILNRLARMRGVKLDKLGDEITPETIDKLAPEFASFPNLFGPDNKGVYGTNTSYYGQGGKSKESIMKFYRDYMNKNKPPAVDSEASYEGNQSSTVVIDKSSFIAYQTQTQGSSGAQFSNISGFDPFSSTYAMS